MKMQMYYVIRSCLPDITVFIFVNLVIIIFERIYRLPLFHSEKANYFSPNIISNAYAHRQWLVLFRIIPQDKTFLQMLVQVLKGSKKSLLDVHIFQIWKIYKDKTIVAFLATENINNSPFKIVRLLFYLP